MSSPSPESPALSNDASVALGLARTAIPFATSRAEEAERWLRVLRMHGGVGAALQALGVGEAPLEPEGHDQPRPAGTDATEGVRGVERVRSVAYNLARCLGGPTVGTTHLLLAVIWVYEEDFEHELRSRGTSRDELLERLARELAPSA
jgi:hypothetical protein